MNAAWPHGDPRDVARAILAAPRFRDTGSDAPQSDPLAVFWNWIGERLAELLRAIGHVLGSRNPLNAAIGAVVVAVVVVAAGYLLFRLVRAARGLRGPRRSGQPAASEPVTTSGELWARAVAAVAAGRLHDAALLFWAAALRALDERGRLRFDPARTPGEVRRVLRDASFDDFARDAVVAIYGAGAATADRLERLSNAYARMFGRPE